MKTSTSKAVPASRPPLERMLRIHQTIHSGKFPNASTLAKELEVSTKSIHRDIEFMRDRLSLPIEFDSGRNGFFYTEDVSAFPTMQITEGEFVAIVLAEKALQQYRGTNFEKPLLNAIEKIKQSLQNTISLNFTEIEQTFSFSNRAEQILDMGVFDSIAKATTHRQQMEISYRKPGQKETEARVVDPYHLANINGEWYLFAYDHARKDIRTFAPARIKSVKLTGETFERPKKFSLEKRLRDSFGVHSGQGEFDVVLHFNTRAADYVREKKWHESQQLRELKNGGVELSLKLSSLMEIERWVLSWGGDAKVLKPRELADAVKSAAKKILQSND
jgi:predicted DNA-binding transcriptional regulator YafY